MIKIDNLTKKYNDQFAVKSLSLDIDEGNVLGFLGTLAGRPGPHSGGSMRNIEPESRRHHRKTLRIEVVTEQTQNYLQEPKKRKAKSLCTTHMNLICSHE